MPRKQKRSSEQKPQVTKDRAKWKLEHLGPTKYQELLLRYIKEQKEVSFVESVGFNWTMLGGLLSRGILYWDRKADGMVLKVS